MALRSLMERCGGGAAIGSERPEAMAAARKLGSFLIALSFFALVHEGAHVLTALAFDEFQEFVVHPYGLKW